VGGEKIVPVTLGLRNIYILPTGYGLMFMAVLTGMLIGSINYNNNLGFLLVFLLGSLGLVAMLHTYGMLYGLRLVASTAAPVFAGQPLIVSVAIDGGDRARMGLGWGIDQNPRHTADLLPGASGTIQVRVPTRHRGPMTPGWLYISCVYPLGLFRAWSRIDPHLTGLVYPRPLSGPAPVAITPGSADAADDQPAPIAGVDDFAGLSAYQPGDLPARIHWRAFSRGRGLQVKRFAGQGGQAGLLDIDRLSGADIEKKLSILCFHVLQADRQGRTVGLKLGPRSIAPGRGALHRERCLRALALFQEG
jgi:uncharacterized protein (DUF58 family)